MTNQVVNPEINVREELARLDLPDAPDATGSRYGEIITSDGVSSGQYGQLVWKNITGIYTPDAGGALPTDSLFIGSGINERSYDTGDSSDWVFHIPHDYAIGTDIYIHAHWGHNGTGFTDTTPMMWTLEVTHAARTATAPFSTFSTPVSTTINSSATMNINNYPRYCHVVEEAQLSAASPSASQLDSDVLAPDSLIKVHTAATTIPTITGGIDRPFLFLIGIHYQANIEGTKNRAPNFYV